MGGGNASPVTPLTHIRGLSPRGRGKPQLLAPARPCLRSIPAWAGETRARWVRSPCLAVYPRVGGGNPMASAFALHCKGLSPRGRGKLYAGLSILASRGSIPAWAGETPALGLAFLAAAVYPRVGGGNSSVKSATPRISGLSPRGRGKRRRCWPQQVGIWSIPAWAGETNTLNAAGNNQPVYPRVGGGNPTMLTEPPAMMGLSPRGRGKRCGAPGRPGPQRSIPAWAGETKRRWIP